MVLRKIPAKGVKNYLIGSRETQTYKPANTALRSVNFTNDYYMGVFQVTFAQFQTILTNATTAIDTNTESSKLIAYTNGVANSGMYYTNALYSAMRPVNIDWYSLRTGTERPVTHTVSSKKWLGLMRHRFSGTFTTPVFDLPSECVWEYACRAGTETDFNDGLVSPTSATAQKLGRFASFSDNRNQDLSKGTMIVGRYRPNAWGLYDMHGNGQELCLDGYKADVSSYGGDDPVISPLDADSKNYIVVRSRPASDPQISRWGTSSRASVAYSTGNRSADISFRVCLTIYE
jgi:formylglycine-generating enzyme required for sulfatase activity